jgi:ribokinase
MENHKIWVLGSSNIDCTYRVSVLPRKGQTVPANAYAMATGGKGANQAIAAAHWGADVAFIGAVGDDSNGKILLDALASRQVNLTHVRKIAGVPSGNAVILVDDHGENCIAACAGANQCVRPAVCEEVPFTAGDWVVAQLEVNLDALEACFQRAADRGCHIVLNPSPYTPLPRHLLEITEMLVANTSEAFELGGIEVRDPRSACECGRQILAAGPQTVVITMGAAGGVLVTHDQSLYFEGQSVNVVDAQGAGDAFLGTLVARLAGGDSLERAMAFAHHVAAFSVTRPGSTQVSLPEAAQDPAGDLAAGVPIAP